MAAASTTAPPVGCTLVAPGLWCGSQAAVRESIPHGVSTVVGLAADAIIGLGPTVLYVHQPPAGESTVQEMRTRLKRACSVIVGALTANENVLVHCSRGQLAQAVCVAVLLGCEGAALGASRCSLPDALRRCTTTLPRPGLLSALLSLEAELSGAAGEDPCRAGIVSDLSSFGAPFVRWEEGQETWVAARGQLIRLRSLSKDPALVHVSSFLSAGEASTLRDMARSRLQPSRVAISGAAVVLDAPSQSDVVADAAMHGTPAAGTAHSSGGSDGGRTDKNEAQQTRGRTSMSCSLGGGARSCAEAALRSDAGNGDGDGDGGGGGGGSRSGVGDRAGGGGGEGGDGQKGAEGEKEGDEVVARLVERAAYLSGLSQFHAEDVQAVRYTAGQEYREHTDYFSLSDEVKRRCGRAPLPSARTDAPPSRLAPRPRRVTLLPAPCGPRKPAGTHLGVHTPDGLAWRRVAQLYSSRTGPAGNRLVSVFACLQPAPEGGETTFPAIGVTVALSGGLGCARQHPRVAAA